MQKQIVCGSANKQRATREGLTKRAKKERTQEKKMRKKKTVQKSKRAFRAALTRRGRARSRTRTRALQCCCEIQGKRAVGASGAALAAGSWHSVASGPHATWWGTTRQHGSLMAAANAICDLCSLHFLVVLAHTHTHKYIFLGLFYFVSLAPFPWKTFGEKTAAAHSMPSAGPWQ